MYVVFVCMVSCVCVCVFGSVCVHTPVCLPVLFLFCVAIEEWF